MVRLPLMAVSLLVPAAALSLPAAAVKADLLAAMRGCDRGFAATAASKKEVDGLLNQLVTLADESETRASDLSGDWVLLYSDAPDIIGLEFQSGPLATVRRIGQQIDAAAGTIENVIEYGPAEWLAGPLSGIGATGDAVQQRVCLGYSVEGTRCKLTIAGAGLRLQQVLGVDLGSVPPLELKGGATLPFGEFNVLYNDGQMRIVKTQQGYWGVNERCAAGEGWGA